MSYPNEPADVRLVGYWIERVSGPLSLCIPQHHASHPYTPSARRRIAAFLRRGDRWQQERGYSWCRFRCEAPPEALGSGHWKQGAWAWPDGLPHYVEAHGLRVPFEIEHAALSGDPLPRPETLGLGWWQEWCAARSPRGFAAALQRWKEIERERIVEFVSHAESKLRTEAAELEATRGVGSVRCLKSSCDTPALTERAHCAWHALTINDPLPLREARYGGEWQVLQALLVEAERTR